MGVRAPFGVRNDVMTRILTRIKSIDLGLMLICFMTGAFLVVALITNIRTNKYQQFSMQAEYFLNGHLEIEYIDRFGVLDTALNQTTGKYYWPLGIFPSVLLAPFVYTYGYIGILFKQGYMQPFITVFTLWVCYELARRHGFGTRDSLFLAFGFVFAGVYAQLAYIPFVWYFGQAVGVALLFAALYEFFQTRRWILIGVFMALLVQTRMVSALTFFFFVWQVFAERGLTRKQRFVNLFMLALPVAISLGILVGLNYIRFGNIFETGYPRAAVGDSFLIETRNKYGYFNLANLPSNIYWYFVATVFPIFENKTEQLIAPYFYVPWRGMGFFFVSPVFLALITRFRITRETLPYWVVSLSILFLLLTHYTAGYLTFGPRYMLDFLPLWYILLLKSFPDGVLRPRHRAIILVSAIVDMYLMSTIEPMFV